VTPSGVPGIPFVIFEREFSFLRVLAVGLLTRVCRCGYCYIVTGSVRDGFDEADPLPREKRNLLSIARMEGRMRMWVPVLRSMIAMIIIMCVIGPADADQEKRLENIFRTGKVRFIPEITISEDSMAGKSFFSGVYDIAMDDRGNLYACDSGENNIKKFDASGSFLGTIGRAGQGPGEFSYPMEVEFSKGRLFVRELMNRRVSILNDQGIFLKSVRIEMQDSWWAMKALPDGRLVVQRMKLDFQNMNAPQEAFIDLFSSELEFIKTLYRHEIRTNTYITEPVHTNVPVPFAPDVYFDVTHDGRVVIGYSGEYEIEIHDPDKGMVATFSHQYTPVEVTAKDKELHFQGMTTTVGSPSGGISRKKGAPDYIVKNTEFPRHKPPFMNIRVDGEGNIWVLPYGPADNADGPEMDVFDKRGSFLGRVRIESGSSVPYRMIPLPSGFWTINFSKDEECSLVKYRISG